MPSSKSGSRLLDRAGHAYVRALGRLVESSRRHAWWVLTGALALTVASGYFAVTHLAINTDTSQVLFHNLPFTKIDRQLEQAFPRLRDRILVIVDGDTAGLAASAARRLAQRLRTDTQSLGAVYEPGGGEFFRRNGLLYLTPQQLRQLTDRLVQAEPMVATLARDPSLRGLFGLLDRALAPGSGHRAATPALEPLLSQLNRTVRAYNAGRFYQLPWAQLMGAANGLQGTRRLIMVTPKQGPDSRAAGAAAINAVRGAIADLHLNQAGGTRVALTGSVVLSQEQLKSVTTGASLSLALSLVLVVVFLAIGLRSLRMILATLSVLLMGLIWTTAFAVGAVGPFNLISISFAVLFVGLGVDFGIQFCTRYYEELRPANQPRAALTRTVVGMGPPLSLAAVAAACSFYSVVPTDYAGIVDLGIIAGTSMFIALFANLTVLPALLVILRVRRKGGALREPFQFGFLPVRRHARGIVIGAAAIGIIAVPLIFQARFDFNLTKLQNPKAPAVVAFRELERGPYSPLPVEALAPDLDRAEQLADRARKLEPVSRAVTLQSYVPADQDRKLAILQETGLLVPPSALQPASTEPAPGPGELEAALAGFTATAARAARAPPAPGLAPVLTALAGALREFHDAHGRDPAAVQALQQRVIGTL
ncbi:MAG TPA: MMPL family transporter, partial [Gammaproteobacteria bacterium]|nr:MMPL family transporter [Gammaproteobacteria bacterium]